MAVYHPRRILAVEDSARRLSLARRCLAGFFGLTHTRQLKSYGLYTPRAALRAVRKIADGAFLGISVVRVEVEPKEPERGAGPRSGAEGQAKRGDAAKAAAGRK